ncbi:hypothetical protein H257_18942 [Aphanomyces astaci]|uniref:Uncharacterized protein n=1 Tax=Aphanomyces astaci TaxID=112090 RepID=W4F9G6_APHAT|nr:hypothetical protein H257_18942 [Aphanomyces astaci]ETV64125.1 hypothetical protein H257_18942 [Aphanomyces astaci]|eukprot:XP_009846391.1 hypothetical protein H257_18942 [Aphanomyces astaci]
MPTLREMSASSSVGSVLHGEPLSSMESMPHAEPLPSVEYVLHGKPLSSVESMSSVELLSSVGSMPHGEPLQLTFDAFALGRATRPKRVKPPGGHRVLSRAQESLAALGMIMELAKHDLLLSPNQQQIFGSRVLEPHSQRVYKKHYRGLWYFFGIIGDYTSLLILRHDCPQHAPAMSVKRLCAYLKYKTGAIGTILHYDDGLPVLDVDGQPVLCDGQWKDPQNMIQLSSAVSAAHKAKGMGQMPYEEQCDACYRLFSDKSLVTGCRHHAGRGRLSRTGNARFSEDFINCMTRIRKHDLWLYTPSPESMCNPLELVNIRRCHQVLSTSNVPNQVPERLHQDVDMQQASRHKSLEMAGRYKQDAQSLLEIAKNQRDKSILQYVPKWRAVFVSNLQAAAGVNVYSSTEPMAVLACKFIKDMINAGLLNKADTDSPMHVANACMKNVQGWDLKSEINDIQRQVEVKACGCATEVRRLVQLLSKYHTGPATPCVIEGYAVPTSPTLVPTSPTLVPTDLDSDATELITSVLPPELSSEAHPKAHPKAFVPPSSSLHAVPPLPLLPFVLMSSSLRTCPSIIITVHSTTNHIAALWRIHVIALHRAPAPTPLKTPWRINVIALHRAPAPTPLNALIRDRNESNAQRPAHHVKLVDPASALWTRC